MSSSSSFYKTHLPSEEYHSRFHHNIRAVSPPPPTPSQSQECAAEKNALLLDSTSTSTIQKRKYGCENLYRIRSAGMRSWVRNQAEIDAKKLLEQRQEQEQERTPCSFSSSPRPATATTTTGKTVTFSAISPENHRLLSSQTQNQNHFSPLATQILQKQRERSPSARDSRSTTSTLALLNSLPDSLLSEEEKQERRIALKVEKNVTDEDNTFLRPSMFKRLSARARTATAGVEVPKDEKKRALIPDDLKNDNDDTLGIVDDDNDDEDDNNNKNKNKEEELFQSKYRLVPSPVRRSDYFAQQQHDHHNHKNQNRNPTCKDVHEPISSSSTANTTIKRPSSATFAQRLYQDRVQHRIENSVTHDDPFGTNRYNWRQHWKNCHHHREEQDDDDKNTQRKRTASNNDESDGNNKKPPVILQAEQHQLALDHINKTMRPLSAVASRVVKRN